MAIPMLPNAIFSSACPPWPPVLRFVSASEVTRAQYVEQGEPIRKQNTLANRHVFKGIGQEPEGKDFHVGSKFLRADAVLSKTVKCLEVVPQPKAGEARLSRWFSRLNDERLW